MEEDAGSHAGGEQGEEETSRRGQLIAFGTRKQNADDERRHNAAKPVQRPQGFILQVARPDMLDNLKETENQRNETNRNKQ